MDGGPNVQSRTWDLDRLAGTVEWYAPKEDAPDCNANDAEAPAKPSRAYLLVPSVKLPDDFAAGGWKTVDLSGCSTLVDGERAGYTIFGKGAGPARRVVPRGGLGAHAVRRGFG